MRTDTDVAGFDSDLAKLIGDGHRSLKVFTTYNIQLTDAQLLQIFRQARHSGALVCVHAIKSEMSQTLASLKILSAMILTIGRVDSGEQLWGLQSALSADHEVLSDDLQCRGAEPDDCGA